MLVGGKYTFTATISDGDSRSKSGDIIIQVTDSCETSLYYDFDPIKFNVDVRNVVFIKCVTKSGADLKWSQIAGPDYNIRPDDKSFIKFRPGTLKAGKSYEF